MKRKLQITFKRITFTIAFCFSFINCFSQAGEWVWLKGDNVTNQPGNFGVQGVPSPTNNPPALYESCEWTDLNGNFWLFGGIGFNGAGMADLWKFNPVTNEWTWMKGPGTWSFAGSYGIQGVPSLTNKPPSLIFASATWTDNQGILWLFGGFSVFGGETNDLWSYNISTNQWTWIKGPGVPNTPGIYGIQGIPSPTNIPSCRSECATAWVDNNDDLWLFGGNGLLNDLWKYNISSNQWTWMKGDSVINSIGIYGTPGIENPLNTPCARYSYSHWKDSSGRLWLMGGASGNSPTTLFHLSDLWRYNPLTNNWAWMGGDSTENATGIYGIKCIASTSNIPGARLENRAVYTDAEGNFWMFGGAQITSGGTFSDVWNDLWFYNVTTNQWCWISGDSTSNLLGYWGTLGISNPSNKPNGRGGAVMWGDNNSHLYIFGGCINNGIISFNDLWKYTIDTNCLSTNVAAPAVAFSSNDTSFCGEHCFDFTDLSTNAPTSWAWSFPGASPDTSTVQNPLQICYSVPNTYTVTLVASNSSGSSSAVYTNFIDIYSIPPAPSITINGDTLISTPAYAYQWNFNGQPIQGATLQTYLPDSSGSYSVTIFDMSGCTANSLSVLITDIENIYNNELLGITPNPSSSEITISGFQFMHGDEIILIDVLGKIIFRKEVAFPTSDFRLLISGFSNGIYLLQLKTREGMLSKKLMVQH